jgi:hypothetical protein
MLSIILQRWKASGKPQEKPDEIGQGRIPENKKVRDQGAAPAAFVITLFHPSRPRWLFETEPATTDISLSYHNY